MEKSDPLYVTYIIDQKNYDLTFIQQDYIKQEVDSCTMRELTKKVFKDPTLDERSMEFLNIKRYVAKIKKNIEPVVFTEDQILFIENNSHSMNSLELAKNIFPEKDIRPLSSEQKTVAYYLKAIGSGNEAEENEGGYKPPRSTAAIIKKVNLYVVNAKWDANDLTPRQKKCVESLKGYLQSVRLISFIDDCPTQHLKNLMEEEFIKGVHDKDDLNSEELNMYVSLCVTYVFIDQTTKSKLMLDDKINAIISGGGDGAGDKLYMTWVEVATQKATYLNQLQNQAKDLAIKLSSSRSTRLKTETQSNESLSKFVEEWRTEEGRARALRIAKIQDSKVKDEIERLENMDEYLASIFGVSPEELTKF